MRVTLSVPVLLVLGVAGCASTKMSSLVNTDASPREYARVAVAFPLSDLTLRQVFEDEFVGRAETPGRFVPSYKLFFPGQEIGDEQFNQVLRDNRIDAVLRISFTEGGTTSTRTSESTTECTTPQSSPGVIDTRPVRCATTGGYSFDKPWAAFTAALFDLDQNAVVWYATARTGGNAWADTEDLLRSMARETMESLNRDGVVR